MREKGQNGRQRSRCSAVDRRGVTAKQSYDFHAEQARCLRLIDKVASTDIEGEWPLHPMLGRMKGTQISRLHAKHLNHHLTQFGV